jgi:hypothetical protein
MHTNSRHIMSLMLGFLVVMSPCLATAQTCPPNCPLPPGVTTAVKMFYTYDLHITSVAPPPYVENQPILVGYRLVVDKAGVVGELPAPRDGSICGARRGDSCVSIGHLTVGRTISGSVTSTAVAGQYSPIVIYLTSPVDCPPGQECFGSVDLDQENVTRPVAARYRVSIDSFTILRTRARHEDTVNISLMAAVDGQRSAQSDACNILGPPTYCVQNVKQGDHNNGTFQAKGVLVGEYDLIPEVDADLKFSFTVLNFGTSYNQVVAQDIFNGISDFTSGALSAYSGSSGSGGGSYAQLNDFTHKINALEFGGCDGPVAVDAVSVPNKTIVGNSQSTIESRTHSTGRLTGTGPTTGGVYEIDSQDGCGKSGQYKVSWAVTRTSWLAPQ